MTVRMLARISHTVNIPTWQVKHSGVSYSSSVSEIIVQQSHVTKNGNFLPAYSPPPSSSPPPDDNKTWDPFPSRIAFDFSYFHFVEQQTSKAGINKALDLWAASILEYGVDTPWSNTQELYATIDTIQHGEAPWKTFKLYYNGPLPEGIPPHWMMDTFELCTHDSRTLLHQQLGTNEFKDKIHYVPYQQMVAVFGQI